MGDFLSICSRPHQRWITGTRRGDGKAVAAHTDRQAEVLWLFGRVPRQGGAQRKHSGQAQCRWVRAGLDYYIYRYILRKEGVISCENSLYRTVYARHTFVTKMKLIFIWDFISLHIFEI